MTSRSLPRRPTALPALALGAALLLTAACGGASGSGSGTDEEQITELVETFFTETFGDDPEDAYDMLSVDAKAACSRQDFIEQAEFAGGFLEALGGGEFKVERVFDIRVTGDTATAKVEVTLDGEPSDEGPEDSRFVREGGRWKIGEGC